jgi:hypothetical protein
MKEEDFAKHMCAILKMFFKKCSVGLFSQLFREFKAIDTKIKAVDLSSMFSANRNSAVVARSDRL